MKRSAVTGLFTCDVCNYRNPNTLFRTVTQNGRESVYLDDISRLEALVGPDLMLGILECGIWTDRLFTLRHLTPSVEDDVAAAAMSVEDLRDQQTLFFLACGCLRELAKSFRALLSAGIEGLLRTDEARTLVAQLQEQLDRWDARTVFVKVRNQGSFHIDRPVLARGLQYARGNAVVFVERDHPDSPLRYRRFKFAHELLIAGLFIPDHAPPPGTPAAVESTMPDARAFMEGARAIVEAAAADQLAVVALFDGLLLETLNGLQAGWTPLPPTQPPVPRKKEPRLRARFDLVKQALGRVGRMVPNFDRKADLPDQVAQLENEIKHLRRTLRKRRTRRPPGTG
jgi:hypothetical protein